MLRKRVIVCLDVRDGRVVKGVQFVGLRDVGDPVELARRYEAEGADEIVFLDISASAEGRRTLLDVVRRTAERLFIPLTVGGGIHEVDDVAHALRAGADKVSLNTAAVLRPELLTEAAERFGSQCVVASIDAKIEVDGGSGGLLSGGPVNPEDHSRSERRPHRAGDPRRLHEAGALVIWGDRSTAEEPTGSREEGVGKASGTAYRVYTHGGRSPTELEAIAWAEECAALGAGEILLTSIAQDGARTGYDLELTRWVAERVSVPVIASGGAGNAEHLRDAFLLGQADAALAAGIFHDGLTTVAEVKGLLADAGISVRMPHGNAGEIAGRTVGV